MKKLIYITFIFFIASCNEHNIGENKSIIPCQICMLNIELLHLEGYIQMSYAERERPNIIEEYELKLSSLRFRLDSLLSIYEPFKSIEKNSKLELAYNKCLDLYPLKVTDSLKKDELFEQFFFYDQVVVPLSHTHSCRSYPNDKYHIAKMSLNEYIECVKKDTISFIPNEDNLIEVNNFGVATDMTIDEFDDYLKKQKLKHENFYSYIKSKIDDITKLLYNKSYSSLSEAEVFALRSRVYDYKYLDKSYSDAKIKSYWHNNSTNIK